MYTKSGKVPGMLAFSLKDLIVIIQKLEEIKFIYFWGGGEIRVLETKVAKFAKWYSLFCFKCNFLIGWEKDMI